MSFMPLLDVEYLEDDQRIYECQLRDLPYEPMNAANIALLKRKVVQYRGDPTDLKYITSNEGQVLDFIRCVAGLKLFLKNYSKFDYHQRINRVLHFYYRLKRLALVGNPRWSKYVTRVENLMIAIQSGKRDGALPEAFQSWARSANITTDTIEPEEGENLNTTTTNTTKNTKRPTGTKPKPKTPTAQAMGNGKAGASGKQPDPPVNDPEVDENFNLPGGLHSTMHGPTQVTDEMMRKVDNLQRRQEEMSEQAEKRMNDLYTSVMEALRTMRDSQQQPQPKPKPKQPTRQQQQTEPTNPQSPRIPNTDSQFQQQDQPPPQSQFDQSCFNQPSQQNKSNFQYSSQNQQPSKSNFEHTSQQQRQNKTNYPYSSQQQQQQQQFESGNYTQSQNRQQQQQHFEHSSQRFSQQRQQQPYSYAFPSRQTAFTDQSSQPEFAPYSSAPNYQQPFANNRTDGRSGNNGQSHWNQPSMNPNASDYVPNYNNYFPNQHNSTQDSNMNSSMNTSRDTVLNKLQQLPRWQCRFSGNHNDTKNQTLNEYIASIQNFIRTVDLSPRDMMRNIYPTLKEEALHFYLSLPNTENLSLDEFFSELRNRFGDKRGAASAVVDLIKNKFDERGSILGHIDDLIFKMRMLPFNWSEPEQLDIIRQTLPDTYLKPIVYRGVTTIRQLKEFCLEAFPANSSNRRRPERDYKKTKVMSLEVVSEEEIDTESENEDDPMEKICSVVKQWEKKPNFKRNDKLKSNFPKTDSQPKHKKTSDGKPKAKKAELFCGNCLTEGHSHHTCKNPKRIYCFHCGTAGSTVNNCESEACKQSKNE